MSFAVQKFKQIVNDKPITKEEFERTKNNISMQLPGRWETNGVILGSLTELMKYELAPDYFKNFSKNVNKMTLEDVQKLSKQMLNPDKLAWVVVGDKDKIFKGLQEVGFDEIVMIDADGNILPGNSAVKPNIPAGSDVKAIK